MADVEGTPQPERCCFDEWAAGYAKRARRKRTASAVTAALLDVLEDLGLAGRTVLDVGCGVGDLAIEAVRRGAAGADGIDLSPRAVAEARRLAVEAGLSDLVSFTVGDGAEAALAPHDVVVLNRVTCCYPALEALLTNALSVAGSILAYTTPLSWGAMGLLNRTGAAVENAWYRLRERRYRGFRVFVHDCEAIAERVRGAGFRPVVRGRARLAWDLAAFQRVPL